jgi:hypothetical protein
LKLVLAKKKKKKESSHRTIRIQIKHEHNQKKKRGWIKVELNDMQKRKKKLTCVTDAFLAAGRAVFCLQNGGQQVVIEVSLGGGAVPHGPFRNRLTWQWKRRRGTKKKGQKSHGMKKYTEKGSSGIDSPGGEKERRRE